MRGAPACVRVERVLRAAPTNSSTRSLLRYCFTSSLSACAAMVLFSFRTTALCFFAASCAASERAIAECTCVARTNFDYFDYCRGTSPLCTSRAMVNLDYPHATLNGTITLREQEGGVGVAPLKAPASLARALHGGAARAHASCARALRSNKRTARRVAALSSFARAGRRTARQRRIALAAAPAQPAQQAAALPAARSGAAPAGALPLPALPVPPLLQPALPLPALPLQALPLPAPPQPALHQPALHVT